MELCEDPWGRKFTLLGAPELSTILWSTTYPMKPRNVTRPHHIKVEAQKKQRIVVGVVFIFFIAIAAGWIVYLSLREGVGAKVEETINQDVSGMGMGGGLAAVGMAGFDVGKSAKDVKGGSMGGSMDLKDTQHHQHNEFKAPLVRKNEDPSFASVSRALDDLPKAAENDFDAVTALVQCGTSKGNVTIDVRGKWSPKGAEQFLKLVRLGHFDDLPFYRVAPRYITQFGRKYRAPDKPDPLRENHIEVIKDDPSLWGLRDMDFGYVFFAGAGPNTRYDEMVVAFCPMKGCIATGLGHADWEVPVATIRKDDFGVLNEIMSSGKPYPRLEMGGQHPKAGGPHPGRMEHEEDYLRNEYPFMEYWKGCRVHSTDRHLHRPLHVDHPDSKQRTGINGRVITAAITTGNDKGDGDTPGAGAGARRDGPSLRGGAASVAGAGAGAADEGLFRVKLRVATATKGQGDVVLEIHPSWAPLAAERFQALVKSGIFNNARFFRVIKHFMAQFGIPASPHFFEGSGSGGDDDEASKAGKVMTGKALADLKGNIPDEGDVGGVGGEGGGQGRQSNTRGMLTFAHAGKNTRGHQLFINIADNPYLDKQGFPPFGRVVEGMEYVDALYDKYGEGGKGDGSDHKGPSQGRIAREGNPYLDQYFPKLSYIVRAELL